MSLRSQEELGKVVFLDISAFLLKGKKPCHKMQDNLVCHKIQDNFCIFECDLDVWT